MCFICLCFFRGGFHFRLDCSHARDRLHQKHFDVVILDMGLPDGSGWELLSDIRTRLPDARIVILSGADMTPWRPEKLRSCCSNPGSRPMNCSMRSEFVSRLSVQKTIPYKRIGTGFPGEHYSVGWSELAGGNRRQFKREATVFSLFRADADVASHMPGQIARNVQPQPGAALVAPFVTVVCSCKTFEQSRLKAVGNADTIILNSNLDASGR